MSNISDVNPARAFAYAAHLGQRYGDSPYSVHLDAAAEVYRRFVSARAWYGPVDDEILAAIYLHDTMEDTEVEYIDLLTTFGRVVAELVFAVTDKPGRNRAARHAATYPGIRAAGWRAVAVKLCDRIANVEHSVRTKDEGKLNMYAREHAKLRRALYDRLDPTMVGRLWAHLDKLLSLEAL